MTDLAERLRRYSYKPGWVFTVGEHEGKPALVVLAEVPDVLGRKERFVLRGAKPLPVDIEGYSDTRLAAWTRRLVDAMEQHERDEWFRLDGKPINDPHGEQA